MSCTSVSLHRIFPPCIFMFPSLFIFLCSDGGVSLLVRGLKHLNLSSHLLTYTRRPFAHPYIFIFHSIPPRVSSPSIHSNISGLFFPTAASLSASVLTNPLHASTLGKLWVCRDLTSLLMIYFFFLKQSPDIMPRCIYVLSCNSFFTAYLKFYH